MTNFIGRLALALTAVAVGTGTAVAGHAGVAQADPADTCHHYQFQSSYLMLNLPVAGNRLDQENTLPTDPQSSWCLQPYTVNGKVIATKVVNKASGQCMFARGDLGGAIYAQACSDDQLGEAWNVGRKLYNGTPVVWFTSYYFNVNVDVYHDRRDSGAPVVAYRPDSGVPTANELMREQ
jgi:hypothetical protein